ncbi:MAG TPA: YtxH domain-containing protein [Bacteroidia bacterium]|jgi:gas vesicle protein|nr:YtxH domain-containing protein [Bacteroidia bacterium]
MSNSESTGSAKVIGALIAGAAAGAALGILFAPDKGSETRKKIFKGAKDMACDVTDRVKETVEQVYNKAENAFASAGSSQETNSGAKNDLPQSHL